MYDEPKITEAEWALIVEMLERERSELPVEIHHTRTPVFAPNCKSGRKWCGVCSSGCGRQRPWWCRRTVRFTL